MWRAGFDRYWWLEPESFYYYNCCSVHNYVSQTYLCVQKERGRPSLGSWNFENICQLLYNPTLVRLALLFEQAQKQQEDSHCNQMWQDTLHNFLLKNHERSHKWERSHFTAPNVTRHSTRMKFEKTWEDPHKWKAILLLHLWQGIQQ